MNISAEARTVELLLLGMAAGGAAVVALAAIVAGRRLVGLDRVPIAGFAVVAVTAVVTTIRQPLDGRVLLGVGLLAVLPTFSPREPDQRWRAIAAVPGAAVLAFLAPSGEGGLELAAFVAIPLVGGLIAHFDRAHKDPSLALIALSVACGAAFLSLPDTQHIAAMTGVAAAVGVGALLIPRLALGVSVYAWVGLLVWIASADGSARPASMVGTLGALALVTIEPAIRLSRHSRRGLLRSPDGISPRSWAIGFGIVSSAVAVLSARLAGTRSSTLIALAIVAGLWAVISLGVASLTPETQR